MAISRADLNRQFAEAILSKDCKIETVEALLTQGAEADTAVGETYALHIAAFAGNAPLVELLLEHKANPALTNGKGKTAIEVAMDVVMAKDVEVVREKYWQVVEKFKPSFSKIGVDVLNKVFVPFLKLAPSHFANMIMIKGLLRRGIDLNQIYMMPAWNNSSEETRPLHYQVTVPGSHAVIKLLLENGADPALTCRDRDDTQKTAIEIATDYRRTEDDQLWDNTLTIIEHAKLPIDPVILGRVFLPACRIQNVQSRQHALTVLFRAKASLTTFWEGDELFPKTGTLEEKNTFAAVKFIDEMTADVRPGQHSRKREDIWLTVHSFLDYIDQAALQKKLRIKKYTHPEVHYPTTFSVLGCVLTYALLANTESSHLVANRLLAIGEVDANYQGTPLFAKSTYPLMIAARQKNHPVMLKLLSIGADPNYSKEAQGYYTIDTTVLDILVEDKAWAFIPQFVAASKVQIKPNDVGHAVLAAIKSADPVAIAAVKPLLEAFENSKIERENPQALDYLGMALDHLVADSAITPERKALIPLLLERGALPGVPETTVDLKALGGDALHDAYVKSRRLKQEEAEKEARDQAEREAAYEKAQQKKAKEKEEKEKKEQEREARFAAIRAEQSARVQAQAVRERAEQTAREERVLREREQRERERAEQAAREAQILREQRERAAVAPPPVLETESADSDEKPMPHQASIVAAFKKILVMLNETTFMKDKSELEPNDLINEMISTEQAHPHGRVAFASQFAQNHHLNFNEHNFDLVLALRRESFKRKLCSKTIIGNLTFYRAKSFDKYVSGLSADDKRSVVAEMRGEADDVKCDTRSAFIIRELRK